MQTPREPVAGMNLQELIAWARAMHRWSMSQRLAGGPGVRVTYGPGGVTIKGNAKTVAKKSGAAAAAAVLPFQISDQSVLTGTPVAKVLISYGLVNNGTPTYGGTSLSLAPLITLTSAATWLIYIKWNVGASVGIVDITTGALPADDATYSYNIIGEADVVASGGGFVVDAIRQAKVSSLTVQFCSGTLYFWAAQ